MSIVKKTEVITVYESPDGGITVYSREVGQIERKVASIDGLAPEIYNQWILWRDILKYSQDSVALKDLIDKAEITYALIKKDTTT